MSGGRATVRARKGQKTANAAGDICAQTPEAQKLANVITWELKCGYPLVTVSDLLDKKSGKGFLEFVQQAEESASLAGTANWGLVIKRDRREPLIFIGAWSACGGIDRIQVRVGDRFIMGMTLDAFFQDRLIKNWIQTEARDYVG
jgi:hypothetical protein